MNTTKKASPKPSAPSAKKRPSTVATTQKIVPKSEPTARARARAKPQLAQTAPATGAGDAADPLYAIRDALAAADRLTREHLDELRADPQFVDRCSFPEFCAIFCRGTVQNSLDQAPPKGALLCYLTMIKHRLNPNAEEMIVHGNLVEDRIVYEPILPAATMRRLAEQTGQRAGETEPQWCGEDGVWLTSWPRGLGVPTAARQGIYKQGCPQPFWGVAYFEELCPYKWDAQNKTRVTPEHWLRKPASQLLKCAQVAGNRNAFPDLGFRSPEELEAANNPRPIDQAPLRQALNRVEYAAAAVRPAPSSIPTSSVPTACSADAPACGYVQTDPSTATAPGWGPDRPAEPPPLVPPLKTDDGREFARRLFERFPDEDRRREWLSDVFATVNPSKLSLLEIQKGLVDLRRLDGHQNPTYPSKPCSGCDDPGCRDCRNLLINRYNPKLPCQGCCDPVCPDCRPDARPAVVDRCGDPMCPACPGPGRPGCRRVGGGL